MIVVVTDVSAVIIGESLKIERRFDRIAQRVDARFDVRSDSL